MIQPKWIKNRITLALISKTFQCSLNSMAKQIMGFSFLSFRMWVALFESGAGTQNCTWLFRNRLPHELRRSLSDHCYDISFSSRDDVSSVWTVHRSSFQCFWNSITNYFPAKCPHPSLTHVRRVDARNGLPEQTSDYTLLCRNVKCFSSFTDYWFVIMLIMFSEKMLWFDARSNNSLRTLMLSDAILNRRSYRCC